MSDFDDLVGASGGGRELVERLLATGLLSPAELAGLAPGALAPDQHPTLPHEVVIKTTMADLELPDLTMSMAPAVADTPSGSSSLPGGPPISLSAAVGTAGPRYRMGKVLGKGGMGEVRLATDTALGREIALKRMLDTSAPSQVRRFAMEARVTGRLEHPNIIPVHELGRGEDGAPYFTMKRVKGDSLGDLIAKLKTDFEDTRENYGLTRRLRVFLGITNAIAFAHSHGVLHRDLKPANVMVGEFGEVLVMDWGLVRVAGESTDELLAGVEPTLDASGDTERTQVGSIVGTPRYMSPEQARGDNDAVDERSDTFALGAILCELLALRPAIPGGTVWQVLEATTLGIRQLPGSLPKDPPTPRELVAVVDKAMALDPDARYESVAALAQDIEAFLEGHVLSAAVYSPLQRLVKWGKRHKMLAVGAAASVLALVLGIGGSISLLHQRAIHQAAQLLVEAQALRAAHDPEGAAQRCIQSLALDPDSAHARQLLGLATLEGDAARRMRLRAGRIAELGAQLARDRATLANADADVDLRGWLEAQTRSFHAARELAMLYGPEAGQPHRLAAAETARAIARRMERTGEHQMATLMLAEATQLGLAPDQVALDRRVMEVEARQRARQASDEVARRLKEVPVLTPGSAAWDTLLAHARGVPQPETTQILLGYIDNYSHRDFAIEALGLLGDRQTTAIARVEGNIGIAQLTDELVWPLAKDVIAELVGPAVAPERYDLDAPRVLACELMHASATPDDLGRLVRVTRALERLNDPRTRRALVLKRWLLGRDSRYWELSATAVAAVSEPPDQVERAARWTDIERALYHEATGRNALAFEAYDAVVAADPTGLWATRRGRLRLEAGEPDRANADAELSLRLGHHPELALRLRALVHARAGRHAEALADLELAISRAAHPGPYQLDRARALEALGRLDEAAAAATLASDANPTNVDAHRLRARVRLAQGQPALAVAEAGAALALVPDDEATLALRARAYDALGIPFAARADHTALVARGDPDGTRALAVARDILALGCSGAGDRGSFRRAWEIAREVIAAHPRCGEAHEIVGRALLLDGSVETSNALAAFREARALGHEPTRMRGWEGITLVQLGRYEEGASAIGEGLALDPPPAELLIALAHLRVASGKLDEAAQVLERAAALAPRSGMALFELARLELRRGEGGRAIDALVRAAERPGTPQHQRLVIHELLVHHLAVRAQERAQKGARSEALADVELALRYPTIMIELRDGLRAMRKALAGR